VGIVTSPLGGLDPIEVGERLRRARDAAAITQADAAAAIGVVRPTLSAIEKGQRRVRLLELQKLALIYGTSVNALVRDEAIHVDLAPRFRKLKDSDDADTLEAVQLLADLARAEVELENLLGIIRARNYPPERPIVRGDVREQAENDANELRQRLGLGLAPIADIVTLLEFELGVRVYVRRLKGKISGLFAFDEVLGPCILLNANHRKDRRTQTAAHECGHFISTRRQPEILHLNEAENSREERYANAFGAAFLAPARAVRQKFQEVVAGSTILTRAHVIVLAHYFNISREALVRRLEDLKLVKPGRWDWFADQGGITDEQERQVLGDLVSPDSGKAEANRPTTLRLSLLASEAYRQELMSEGQLAKLLRLDRVELRAMFADLEMEGSDADGIPILPD
jgi:Zn-dependent peptidase ImmA (M78 family)/DNA-binding XRE family transcriptional regulator